MFTGIVSNEVEQSEFYRQAYNYSPGRLIVRLFVTENGTVPYIWQDRQFYESALNDHENAFRNMKTHETKCTKTHGKSLQKRMDKVYESASI